VKPTCHPERAHHARGLCSACYLVEWRAERRRERAPRWQRTAVLVARAERIKRELEAAGDYAMHPPTWDGVAAYLGVKPTTLKRYRLRVREYAGRAA